MVDILFVGLVVLLVPTLFSWSVPQPQPVKVCRCFWCGG